MFELCLILLYEIRKTIRFRHGQRTSRYYSMTLTRDLEQTEIMQLLQLETHSDTGEENRICVARFYDNDMSLAMFSLFQMIIFQLLRITVKVFPYNVMQGATAPFLISYHVVIVV